MIGLEQMNLATLNSNQVKLSNNSSAVALPKPRNQSNGRESKQTNVDQPKSTNSQFNWTGLLANMLQENLKAKKSTSSIKASAQQTLYKPNNYLIKELQNKTQPLPKHLIYRSDARKNEEPVYGLELSDHSEKPKHKICQFEKVKIGIEH